MALKTAAQLRRALKDKGFDSRQIQALAELLAESNTYATNLNTWATALSTKLNADAGVTDTNYDTNPQA
jgi:hypothetical protein